MSSRGDSDWYLQITAMVSTSLTTVTPSFYSVSLLFKSLPSSLTQTNADNLLASILHADTIILFLTCTSLLKISQWLPLHTNQRPNSKV